MKEAKKTMKTLKKHTIHYKILKLWALLAFGLGVTHTAQAQYDIGYTHYMFNEFFINPAYSGSKQALSITGLGRLQWVGFEGAPQSYALNAHTPLKNDHIGLGAGILYDKIGVGQHISGYFNFAYRVLFPQSTLSFGLQGSVGGQTNHFEDLRNLPDGIENDLLLQQEPMTFIPNVGFGMYYYTKKFFVGFSLPRMLNNNYVETQNKRFNITDWTYYLDGGYVFQINDDFEIMPSAMLKITQGVAPQLDVSVLSLLWKTLWLGIDYRTDNTLSPIVGIQLNKMFRFNYSYDISLDGVKRAQMGGSHEVSLMYTFDYFKKRVVSPRLF